MLRAFLGPLAVTFPVALFILDMQFLWVYADDLMGKGLEFWIVLKLLMYASARLVSLALPLAVLVASIMALGNLAERSELTAMKSSGMSFLQILKPLVICMALICGGAFWFSNTGWPAANSRFRALLYSVTKQKPALNIREGVFYNGIDGFSLRVGKKLGDGNMEDILIHDHRDPEGKSVLVVHAQRGHLTQNDNELVIELQNGSSYEEHQETLSRTKERVHPHIESRFERQTFRIPLNSLDFSVANEELFKQRHELMNLTELGEACDSIESSIVRERGALVQYGRRNVTYLSDTTGWYDNSGSHAQAAPLSPWYSSLASVTRGRMFDKAREAGRNHIRSIENAVQSMTGKQQQLGRHQKEWHRKYILSIACMILFFVGSSLGAMVGRGGLGVPTLLAIVVFLLFYSLSMVGEQLIKSDTLTPWAGMWLSTIALVPIAAWLMWSATNEKRWIQGRSRT